LMGDINPNTGKVQLERCRRYLKTCVTVDNRPGPPKNDGR
jgi:hypothetical protein